MSVVSRMGDERWGGVIQRFFEIVGSQSAPLGGREIRSAGDGALLAFDGPARAILALRSIQHGA